MREAIWYGLFENTTKKGNKTPHYTCVKEWGKCEPLEALRNKDGLLRVYLQDSIKSGSKASSTTPAMRLQAKRSFNLSGLNNYFVGYKLSGLAFGNPDPHETYGKDNKKNPFGKDCKDGFLFLFSNGEGRIAPEYFEMIVLANVGTLVANHCSMLQTGGYDDFLKEVRKQASTKGSFFI